MVELPYSGTPIGSKVDPRCPVHKILKSASSAVPKRAGIRCFIFIFGKVLDAFGFF
jgi:hypothetical protein